jgi:hypothetical protein
MTNQVVAALVAWPLHFHIASNVLWPKKKAAVLGRSTKRMIDDPELVDRLLDEFRAQIPLPARTTPSLAAALREQSPNRPLPRQCRVTRIDYAGDEGGIICGLDFGIADSERAFFVSITHLSFKRCVPLFREIEVYRKRRIKRLRRLHGAMSP